MYEVDNLTRKDEDSRKQPIPWASCREQGQWKTVWMVSSEIDREREIETHGIILPVDRMQGSGASREYQFDFVGKRRSRILVKCTSNVANQPYVLSLAGSGRG